MDSPYPSFAGFRPLATLHTPSATPASCRLTAAFSFNAIPLLTSYPGEYECTMLQKSPTQCLAPHPHNRTDSDHDSTVHTEWTQISVLLLIPHNRMGSWFHSVMSKTTMSPTPPDPCNSTLPRVMILQTRIVIGTLDCSSVIDTYFWLKAEMFSAALVHSTSHNSWSVYLESPQLFPIHHIM